MGHVTHHSNWQGSRQNKIPIGRYLSDQEVFFKTITKALDGISGITKNIFFPFVGVCERRNFDFCVFLRMCSMPGGRVGPGVTTFAPSIQLI